MTKRLLLLLTAALFPLTLAAQPAGKLELRFDHLQSLAEETVDVNLDGAMLRMASSFLSSDEADEAEVKRMVADLRGVYVKSFEFASEGAYTESDVAGVRSQLRGPWQRIVNVHSKDRDDVEIYTIPDGNRIGGMVIIATGPKELTVVQLIGPVDLERLSHLEGEMGIPKLNIDKNTKAGGAR